MDSVGIEPLDFRAKEACTHYISPPNFTLFSKPNAPGETRTRKTVRPADFKSAVYTIPPQEQTSLDKKSSHWVREEPIYYLDCHPQPSLSLHLTLISSETSPVPLRWHLTTRVQKERGRYTPIQPRIVPQLLPFTFQSLNTLNIHKVRLFVKSHLNI